jgi:hypothetical protein
MDARILKCKLDLMNCYVLHNELRAARSLINIYMYVFNISRERVEDRCDNQIRDSGF